MKWEIWFCKLKFFSAVNFYFRGNLFTLARTADHSQRGERLRENLKSICSFVCEYGCVCRQIRNKNFPNGNFSHRFAAKLMRNLHSAHTPLSLQAHVSVRIQVYVCLPVGAQQRVMSRWQAANVQRNLVGTFCGCCYCCGIFRQATTFHRFYCASFYSILYVKVADHMRWKRVLQGE